MQRRLIIEILYHAYTSSFFIAAKKSSIVIAFVISIVWVSLQTVIVHLGALYHLHVKPFRVPNPVTISINTI